MPSEDQKTEMYGALEWRNPVNTKSDLPDIADEGACCYVQDESAVYAYRDGIWVKEMARRKDT